MTNPETCVSEEQYVQVETELEPDEPRTIIVGGEELNMTVCTVPDIDRMISIVINIFIDSINWVNFFSGDICPLS